MILMITLAKHFEKLPNYFPQNLYYFLSYVWEFSFLHILTNTFSLLLFTFQHSQPNGSEVVSYYHCDLHFPNYNNIECLLMCLLAICISYLVKYLFSFKNCFFLFIADLRELFYILENKLLADINWIHFPPFCELSFQFSNFL